MSYSVIATITDLGRQRMAQQAATGKSYHVDQFTVGSGGHDALDPTIALTPDPTLVECPLAVFGPETIDSTAYASSFCPVFTCILQQDEAIAPLSNICMVATIVYSPTPGDPEVGNTFLYAIGNFPLRVKTDIEEITFNVTINF